VSVHVERRGAVLVVTLDRPGKRNAVDAAMTASISAAFDEFEDDPRLRVAILTATGTVFSAGTDLLTGSGEPTARGGKYGLIRRRPVKPVIAAVHGPAIGGGFELVLACDLVVAANDVFFALPETARARVASAGALFRAGTRLPRNLATELLIAGGRLEAERAFALGLVNRLVDPGQVLNGALELASAICGGAPSSVEETMRALRAVDAESELTGWEATAAADARMAGSADRAEGDAAYRERRPPRWAADAAAKGVNAAPASQDTGPVGERGRQQRRGRSIAMTQSELDAFLGTERTCRVASISAGGRPHVSPLWFVWDGSALWLNSVVRSQRWRDLERNPAASVVVDAGEEYTELRGVELTGRVQVMSEVPRTSAPLAAVAQAERRFALKYTGTPDFVPDGRHAWLRLAPEKLLSWDFRKNPRLQPRRAAPAD
jgi:enoyl-CoA hydratase